MNRLVTISFSHYCEKARWALDRAGIAYVEEAHLPLFAWVPALRAGRIRTVPSLVTPEGAVPDSTDILHWCDRHGDAPALFPAGAAQERGPGGGSYGVGGDAEVAALEDHLDKKLGPHSRRMAYGHVLPAMRTLLDNLRGVPRLEIRAARLLERPIRALMTRGLKVTPDGIARSRARVDGVWAEIEARLADGRRYLCGDRFTAADLTFAALAVPLILPPELADFVPSDAAPPAMRAEAARWRDTAAGAFALRLYAEERGRPGVAATSRRAAG